MMRRQSKRWSKMQSRSRLVEVGTIIIRKRKWKSRKEIYKMRLTKHLKSGTIFVTK